MMHWFDTEMFCFICKVPQANANSLTTHLKLIHRLCSGKTLCLKCGQPGSHFFGTFYGFRKHLNKAHKSCDYPGEGPSKTEGLAGSFVDDFTSNSAPSNPVLLNKSLVDQGFPNVFVSGHPMNIFLIRGTPTLYKTYTFETWRYEVSARQWRYAINIRYWEWKL